MKCDHVWEPYSPSPNYYTARCAKCGRLGVGFVLDKEIERLKGQIDVRDAVIAKLSGTVAKLRPLLAQAADALENHVNYAIDLGMSDDKVLIAELREASK